jgi:hypothetical protein
VLHPSVAGDVQRWPPGTTFVVGGGRETLQATLADDEDEGRDLVRLVVTTEPTSFASSELVAPAGTWTPARSVRGVATGPTADEVGTGRDVGTAAGGGGGLTDGSTTAASTPVTGAWASATIEVITTRGPAPS